MINGEAMVGGGFRRESGKHEGTIVGLLVHVGVHRGDVNTRASLQ